LTGNLGFLLFTGTSGADVGGALRTAIGHLGTNLFQDLRQTSAVLPGSVIGGVEGAGEVYSADYVVPGSGRRDPVTAMVMAATESNLTISVLAVGYQSLDNFALLPFGLEDAQVFDFEPLNTIWPEAT
jgi:hypothetical protein